MDPVALLPIITYGLLIVAWGVIVGLYAAARRVVQRDDRVVAAMLALLGLDALRSLLESAYFTIVWAGNYGVAFVELSKVLASPQLLAVPKLLNLAIALTVIGLFFRRLLPHDLAARRAERQRSEASHDRVVKAERRWQLALSATQDLILEWDREAHALWVSPELVGRLGIRSDRANVTPWFEAVVDDERAAVASAFQDFVVGRATHFSVEHRVQSPEGRVLRLHARAAAERNPEGVATRVVVAFADVTALRLAEAKRRDAQANPVGAVAKALPSGVAHELNNALQAVAAHAHTAGAAAPDNESVAESVEAIDQAVARASALTRQLLMMEATRSSPSSAGPADPKA